MDKQEALSIIKQKIKSADFFTDTPVIEEIDNIDAAAYEFEISFSDLKVRISSSLPQDFSVFSKLIAESDCEDDKKLLTFYFTYDDEEKNRERSISSNKFPEEIERIIREYSQ